MRRTRPVLRIVLLLAALAAAFVAGQLTAAQPAMNAALANLREARVQLNRATGDKGGHRARALALVDDAIEQVQKGMAFDRRR